MACIGSTSETKLWGKLSCLVLLRLAHHNGQDVGLLSKMSPTEFDLLQSPLLRVMLLLLLRQAGCCFALSPHSGALQASQLCTA